MADIDLCYQPVHALIPSLTDRELWEGSSKVLSETERAEYEEKAAKLR
jgi:hypothetical protein